MSEPNDLVNSKNGRKILLSNASFYIILYVATVLLSLSVKHIDLLIPAMVGLLLATFLIIIVVFKQSESNINQANTIDELKKRVTILESKL